MFGNEVDGKQLRNERQRQLIRLVAQGLTNTEVAQTLGTTEHVVKNHLREIYDQLGLWNRVELALWHEAREQEHRIDALRRTQLGGGQPARD